MTPKGEIAQSAGFLNVIRFARVPPLEFGALRFGAQTVSAADLHAADSIFPDTVDGILGYDFLSTRGPPTPGGTASARNKVAAPTSSPRSRPSADARGRWCMAIHELLVG